MCNEDFLPRQTLMLAGGEAVCHAGDVVGHGSVQADSGGFLVKLELRGVVAIGCEIVRPRCFGRVLSFPSLAGGDRGWRVEIDSIQGFASALAR